MIEDLCDVCDDKYCRGQIICVACRNGDVPAKICVKSLEKEGVSVFHENLRLKRKERGLSQEKLASRLHVVRQTISKWEKGVSHS